MPEEILYFRTRGGPVHGWGNIIRLSSFADYCLTRSDYEIQFFAEGPKDVIDYLKDKGFKVVELPEDVSIEDEYEIISKYPGSGVIMEMLDCNYNRQKMLKDHFGQLFVFDDLLDHVYCADVVICGQVLPGYSNKEISDNRTRFFMGYEYFLCRPEFEKYISRSRHYSKRIEKILVTFGGGQYDIAYLKAAYALAKYKETITPTFILGYAVQDRLKGEIREVLPHAKIYGGVKNIDELFWQSDLAIVSGGYSKFESAVTKTPSIIISVQWHQIPLAEEFSKITRMPYIGYMSYITVAKLTETLNALSDGSGSKLVEGYSNIIDGRGFERVYSIIFGG